MLDKLTKFFASRFGIVLTGESIGILATLLQQLGNPPNEGICVTCFERDIAGALGLHRVEVVRYIRPEIIGFVLGSTLAALAFREFKARAGSAPLVRFIPSIRGHEIGLTKQLLEGLSTIPGVLLYGPGDPAQQTATVSFNISGCQPSEVGQLLDEEHGILCRIGLQCAPAAHRTMGTFPSGTVRFGLGAFNTKDDVRLGLDAVRELAER